MYQLRERVHPAEDVITAFLALPDGFNKLCNALRHMGQEHVVQTISQRDIFQGAPIFQGGPVRAPRRASVRDPRPDLFDLCRCC